MFYDHFSARSLLAKLVRTVPMDSVADIHVHEYCTDGLQFNSIYSKTDDRTPKGFVCHNTKIRLVHSVTDIHAHAYCTDGLSY